MDVDKAQMREGAKAATQGEWSLGEPGSDGSCQVIGPTGLRGVRILSPDARHIANCSPPAIISLLDELDRLQAEPTDVEMRAARLLGAARTLLADHPDAKDWLEEATRWPKPEPDWDEEVMNG